MPIGSITQTISELPAAGHRGVDVQTQFVIKQEDFQDHLQGVTVDELNALVVQQNTMAEAMNSTATQVNTNANTATTQAGIATTKASEASASALSVSTSASTATTKANEASTSASQASTSASTATTKASEASTSASQASTSASQASTSASQAETFKNSANTSASTATTKASEASTSAAASLQSARDSAANAALFPEHISNRSNPHGVTADQVGAYSKTSLDLKISTQQFDKPSKGPLFIKVSPSSIKIPAGLKISVGTESFKVITDYTLSLATNLVGSTKTAGTDYYVYAKSDSTFYISASAAITADRLIGGFHYGLVVETETVTGNKLEADMVKIRGINQYSFWDLKYRPVASTKGMVNIGYRWYDIYLLNSEHITNGTSRAGLWIAGGAATYGRVIPKIPLEYGGNNTINYGKFTWFQACEIAKAHGKELISYAEFPTIAYGVTEMVSSSTNGYETVAGKIEHYPNLTSKYGIEQAVGTEWIWGSDVQGIGGTAWITGVTDSRGDIYAPASSPTAVVLGGYLGDGVNAGSRASLWDRYVWFSGWHVGCRYACDHLELE